MTFDINARSILLVQHGSHCYGLNTATSDVDVKGVAIEPKAYHFGFVNRFEQYERMGNTQGGNLTKLNSLNGKDTDVVIYSLKKFVHLASDANPNIIEVLHVDDSDIIHCDKYGEMLREHKELFISAKARFTFAGYAHAQLKRIKTHRSWLLNKPSMPNRADFGLESETRVSKSELGAYDSLVTDGVEFPKNVVTLFTREKSYQSAKTHYDQYLNWVKTRNPARAALEEKHGMDTKHAMHLIRLMRMCAEILETGKVVVKRPDREELLGIRNGFMSYDELIEQAERLERECEEFYETSSLPKTPDRNALDALVVKMTESYLSEYG